MKITNKSYYYITIISLYLHFRILSQMSTQQILKDLFAGCCSGWGQVLTMMPFENIKVKVVSKPQEYNGYVDAFKKTVAQQGYSGFYKGMLMPLLGVGVQVSVQFGIVETLKKVLKKHYARPDGTLNANYSFLCGGVAGIFSGIIVAPLDHARFRVSLSKGHAEGSIKTAVNIYRQYGIQKVFLGMNSAILREALGLSLYFGVYDKLIGYFKKEGSVSLGGSLLVGGLAGLSTWATIYPIDYVKTLIQTDSLQNPRYKSSVACAVQEFRTKSIRTFFRGVQIMLARAFVVNAFGFMCFELGKKLVYGNH